MVRLVLLQKLNNGHLSANECVHHAAIIQINAGEVYYDLLASANCTWLLNANMFITCVF